MSDVTVELDARGLRCPGPVLRAKKALKNMGAGEILRVLATDPSTTKDFEALCRQSSHELIETGTDRDEFVFLIGKN